MTQDHDDNFIPLNTPKRRLPFKLISIAIVITLGGFSIWYLPNNKDAFQMKAYEGLESNSVQTLESQDLEGGSGGVPYNDQPPSDYWYVSSIKTCSGHENVVDGIQITAKNYKTGESKAYGYHGGNIGTCKTVSVSKYPEDCFSQVIVRGQKLVDSLTFVKRNGETSRSGGNQGIQGISHTQHFEDQCLAGIYGRAGNLMDSIGFYFSPIQKSNNIFKISTVEETQVFGGDGGNLFRMAPKMIKMQHKTLQKNGFISAKEKTGKKTSQQHSIYQVNLDWKLYKIQLRHNANIDKIMLVDRNVKNGQISQRANVGGNGGFRGTVTIGSNECINGVDVWADSSVNGYLYGLKFYFNSGRQSQHFGKYGGTKTQIRKPKKCLVGIKGRAGTLVDAIGFIFVETN